MCSPWPIAFLENYHKEKHKWSQFLFTYLLREMFVLGFGSIQIGPALLFRFVFAAKQRDETYDVISRTPASIYADFDWIIRFLRK